jgi:hypothetical protein
MDEVRKVYKMFVEISLRGETYTGGMELVLDKLIVTE